MRVSEVIEKLQKFKDNHACIHGDFDPEVKLRICKIYEDKNGHGEEIVISFIEDISDITMTEYLSLDEDKIYIKFSTR